MATPYQTRDCLMCGGVGQFHRFGVEDCGRCDMTGIDPEGWRTEYELTAEDDAQIAAELEADRIEQAHNPPPPETDEIPF